MPLFAAVPPLFSLCMMLAVLYKQSPDDNSPSQQQQQTSRGLPRILGRASREVIDQLRRGAAAFPRKSIYPQERACASRKKEFGDHLPTSAEEINASKQTLRRRETGTSRYRTK